ncbi:MAG: GH3 auxin-responsive promoter family protein [Acidobacteria bacterium]|nr:GH3 auxin-responsive promoter family protein [Acidobacteriota bacterium]
MRRVSTVVANGIWMLSTLPQSAAFHLAVRNVEQAQRQRLLEILRQSANTEFGRRYDFASIRTTAEFQARLPLLQYEDYQPWLERVGDGQPEVLTAEPVLLLEPTSGSTAATKLIPYTASLKAEFQRAIAVWISDLFTHNPTLLGGQAYWSVSPVVRRDARTTGGIPIGFEEDGEYLGRWQHAMLNHILAVPSAVRWISEIESFRYVTLLFLLRSPSLRLISVWNPTFLSLLVACLAEWGPQLAADIAHGTLTTPTPLAEDIDAQLRRQNVPDTRRARELASIFQATTAPGERHARLWPRLRVISCWADAHAALYAQELARLFPQARIQGKGLLATEGFVSFPLEKKNGAALAVRSHFYEFLPPQESDTPPKLAHELIAGNQYAVALTTGGGLYRYQLHDQVEVTGFYGECPLLRFVGKANHIVDWFGEKLNAAHVSNIVTNVLGELTPEFWLLACERTLTPPAYTLFIQASQMADRQLRQLAANIETGLQENFHYRYCRELGQLAAVRAFRIAERAQERYLATCQARGQRAGDIKPAALHQADNWAQSFCGRWL